MSSPAQVTQRDVAQACGVHPSTICLALNNSPSIPPATRRKVQAAAAALGYRPNVAARNLALLRADKGGGGSLPIAWINQEPDRTHWRSDPMARGHFESANRRARELGYHLEEIWAREPGMTAGRLVQIVGARGIEGVIFPVHRHFDYGLLTPAWSEYALVGLNDYRLADWVDVVCPDRVRDLETLFRQVRALGLTRVGLALTVQADAGSHGLVHGCFLRHQGDAGPDRAVPVCRLGENAEAQYAGFRAWLEAHEPDVVIAPEAKIVARARADGYRAVWLGLGEAGVPFDGGLNDGVSQMGRAAVECVVDKMRRFEKGMRESTRVQLLRSAWVEPRVAQTEPAAVVA